MTTTGDKKLAREITSGVFEFLKKLNKEDLISEVINLMVRERDLKKALIYTPKTLNGAEKKKISKMIKHLTGENITDFLFQVDEDLIDGIKISYKDKLWDFSIENQIAGFKKN